MADTANFFVGQIVWHSLFDYRGVVIDVDPHFLLSVEWYDMMAKSRPPKNKPWYRVLVHNSNHETYVAEQNLSSVSDPSPINHPELHNYFSKFEKDKYLLNSNSTN